MLVKLDDLSIAMVSMSLYINISQCIKKIGSLNFSQMITGLIGIGWSYDYIDGCVIRYAR